MALGVLYLIAMFAYLAVLMHGWWNHTMTAGYRPIGLLTLAIVAGLAAFAIDFTLGMVLASMFAAVPIVWYLEDLESLA